MDSDREIVEALRFKRCPIREPHLPEFLNRSWDNLSATTRVEEAVFNSEITLIIVPTPSTAAGDFSNEYVVRVLKDMSPALKRKAFHVVDVVSTVMPGSCERIFKPLLEEMTGKVCCRDFGLVYNPEFIALGSVIRNFLNPDMVLIGSSDSLSAEITASLYRKTCENHPHIALMSLTNAEITKLSVNCYVTTKISFVNQLAAICEKIPGADVDVITDALGMDTRIGGKCMRGGLGFGGPCFPRDNVAFQYFAKEVGILSTLGNKVVETNKGVVGRVVELICGNAKAGGKIVVLGLSYKPNTPIIEESQSVMVVKKLVEKGFRCYLHDPEALGEIREEFGGCVQYIEDPYAGLKDADAIVLLTDWEQYRELDWTRAVRSAQKDVLLVDSWRVLKGQKVHGFRYRGLGVGPRQSEHGGNTEGKAAILG